MLCLQNYENLANILSKAFGGDEKKGKQVSSASELSNILADL